MLQIHNDPNPQAQLDSSYTAIHLQQLANMALLVAGAGYYLAFGCASLAILGLLFSRFTRTTSPYPLPPGPPGEPIIGHLRMVPVENPHLAYMKWGKEYSRTALRCGN